MTLCNHHIPLWQVSKRFWEPIGQLRKLIRANPRPSGAIACKRSFGSRCAPMPDVPHNWLKVTRRPHPFGPRGFGAARVPPRGLISKSTSHTPLEKGRRDKSEEVAICLKTILRDRKILKIDRVPVGPRSERPRGYYARGCSVEPHSLVFRPEVAPGYQRI